MVIKFLVSLIPVFIFLMTLLYLDSMKLVKQKLVLYCLIWGVASAGLSFLINTLLINILHLSFENYSGFIAPVIEEILKFSLLWNLIRHNKIGFMIDGAVYGFSIGAAFSFIENIFYLFFYSSLDGTIIVWVVRGFGTAIMQGGATAIMGIIGMSALNRKSNLLSASIMGGVSAVVLHACYNHFLIYPLLSTAFILVVTPVAIILVFNMNEKSIRNWLELEFDSEVSMLRMIKKGMFSKTKTGSYLVSIKHYFEPEVVVDIYCYIGLYLELSMKAKAFLMLREAGLPVYRDPSVMRKLTELKALKKNIGRGGYLAITPVLKMTRKDLWKISLLANQ